MTATETATIVYDFERREFDSFFPPLLQKKMSPSEYFHCIDRMNDATENRRSFYFVVYFIPTLLVVMWGVYFPVMLSAYEKDGNRVPIFPTGMLILYTVGFVVAGIYTTHAHLRSKKSGLLRVLSKLNKRFVRMGLEWNLLEENDDFWVEVTVPAEEMHHFRSRSEDKNDELRASDSRDLIFEPNFDGTDEYEVEFTVPSTMVDDELTVSGVSSQHFPHSSEGSFRSLSHDIT